MLIHDPLQMLQIALMIIPLFVLHELAHAKVALMLGDTTAKDEGRITLNPLKHIDWIGFALILLVGFGWAKPVMINPANLKNMKRDMAIISIAGPLTNFVLAFILLFVAVVVLNGQINFLFLMAFLSVMLGVFNMLPIPPLDGSKVLASILPDDLYYAYRRFEGYGMFLFLILAITGLLGRIILPMIQSVYGWMLSIMIGIIS